MTTISSTTGSKERAFTLLKPSGISIGDWTIMTQSKSPILNSTEKTNWEHELGLNSLPEMVYGNNFVRISNDKAGISIIFSPHDAMKQCKKQPDLKVSSAKKWEQINKSFKGSIEKSFDWTYTTPYCGSVQTKNQIYTYEKPLGLIEETTERIDIEKLKRQDPIKFYDEILLFEDELADNGVSMLSIKIRVMNDSFFLLQRFYLRVDDVIVRSYDTRLFYEFDQPYILREFMIKEAQYDQVKPLFEKDPTLITDTNFVVNHLPITNVALDKIILPTSCINSF
eukprot:gene9734-11955_t